MELTLFVQAKFSPPQADAVLTASVDYPRFTEDEVTVIGTGQQVVYRLGGTRTLSDITRLLDPAAPLCPTLVFLDGRDDFGPNDFVYAMRVQYTGSPQLDLLRTGLCLNGNITSIGYCPASAPLLNVTGAELPAAISYSFSGSLAQNRTAVVFYTSPDPPGLVPTFIASSAVASQGVIPGTILPLPPGEVQAPIYGACPIIMITKEVACSPSGPFRPDQLSVTPGTRVFYKITVKNTGLATLQNVMISDTQLKAGGDLTADFNTATNPMDNPFNTPGQLAPGETIVKVFGPFEATTGPLVPGSMVGGENIALVNALYPVPTPRGEVSGLFFPVFDSDTVTLNVGAVNECPTCKCDTICFQPPSLCVIFLDKLPNGAIFVGGVNFNNPVNIRTQEALIKSALQGGSLFGNSLTPLQRLNKGYVAAQLSLLRAGGSASSPVAVNALWSCLRCYNTQLAGFTPIALSNGKTLSPDSMVKELFDQARQAILSNNTGDMLKLAGLFEMLNTCGQPS